MNTTVHPKDTTVCPKDTTVHPKDTTVHPKDTTVCPKIPRCTPRTLRCTPSIPQCAPIIPQCTPRMPQWAPRIPQCAPRTPQCTPRTLQCAPREYYANAEWHRWEIEYWNEFSQAQKLQVPRDRWENRDPLSNAWNSLRAFWALMFWGDSKLSRSNICDKWPLTENSSAEKNNLARNVEDPSVCALLLTNFVEGLSWNLPLKLLHILVELKMWIEEKKKELW